MLPFGSVLTLARVSSECVIRSTEYAYVRGKLQLYIAKRLALLAVYRRVYHYTRLACVLLLFPVHVILV